MGTLIQQRRQQQLEQDILTDEQLDDDAYLSSLLAHAKDTRPEYLYRVLAGDRIWEVARKLKLDAKELAAHNDLDIEAELVPGTLLHLYEPRPQPTMPQVAYKTLPEPVQMHVTKAGGTKKWLFGNITKISDLGTHGFYPDGANVTIVATAEVPVQMEDGKISTVGYYMDSTAFNTETNQPVLCSGFNWSDLQIGIAPKEEKLPEPEPTPAAAVVEPTPVVITTTAETLLPERAAEEPERYPNYWKATYTAYDEPLRVTGSLPQDVPFIWAYDHDERRPPRRWHDNQEIDLAGHFYKDGVMYGRPVGAASNHLWFGIPMDSIIANGHLYNTDVSTRISVGGSLGFSERFVTEPLSRVIHSPRFARLKQWAIKNQQNKKG